MPIDQQRLQETRKRLQHEFDKPVPYAEILKSVPGGIRRRSAMIELTKLNDVKFQLNGELIETIEATPDSVIMLVTGRKYIVKENVDEILEKCIHARRLVSGKLPNVIEKE